MVGGIVVALVVVVGFGWLRLPVAVFVRFHPIVRVEEVGYGVGLLLGDYFVVDQGREQLRRVVEVGVRLRYPGGEGRDLVVVDDAHCRQHAELAGHDFFVVPVRVPDGGGLARFVPVQVVGVFPIVLVGSVLVQPVRVFPGLAGSVLVQPVAVGAVPVGFGRLLVRGDRRRRPGVGVRVGVPVAGGGHHREQGDHGQQAERHRQYLPHCGSFLYADRFLRSCAQHPPPIFKKYERNLRTD